ncbi:MAG: hypothetical protein AAF555_06365 [Verrucomicrobiota bacterium]
MHKLEIDIANLECGIIREHMVGIEFQEFRMRFLCQVGLSLLIPGHAQKELSFGSILAMPSVGHEQLEHAHAEFLGRQDFLGEFFSFTFEASGLPDHGVTDSCLPGKRLLEKSIVGKAVDHILILFEGRGEFAVGFKEFPNFQLGDAGRSTFRESLHGQPELLDTAGLAPLSDQDPTLLEKFGRSQLLEFPVPLLHLSHGDLWARQKTKTKGRESEETQPLFEGN